MVMTMRTMTMVVVRVMIAISCLQTSSAQLISTGRNHTCVIQSYNGVVCYGSGNLRIPPYYGYTQLSSGGDTMCALSDTGRAACWNVARSNETVLVTLAYPPTYDNNRVYGSVACWGDNTYLQSSVPTAAASVTFTQVSAGGQHTCALSISPPPSSSSSLRLTYADRRLTRT